MKIIIVELDNDTDDGDLSDLVDSTERSARLLRLNPKITVGTVHSTKE